MALWHCLDRLSGERFEVHGADEEEIDAAVRAYIRSGIDADTGDVAYDVLATAINGNEHVIDGEVSCVQD